MDNDIIKHQELIGTHTKVLRKSPENPQALVAYIVVKEYNGQLRTETGFAVFDKFGKQVFKSEYLELALRAYNKLR